MPVPRPRRPELVAVALAIAAAACGTAAAPAASVAFTDHHVHVLGPDVMRDWRALGVTFSRADSIYTSPGTLLRVRPDTSASAVLVPMAHLYGNAEFVGGLGIDDATVRERVRRENAHVAAEAARFPGRAIALCSVPALAAWAPEEFRWCADTLRVSGLKLHLASSMVDLRNEAHLDALARIAGFAASRSLPILLHVDPQRRGLDAPDIERLASRMFEPHPELAVVIAHLGGSGGYGPWTRRVFATLLEWRRATEAREGRPRRLHFELSAVVLERESEGVPATTPEERALLAADLRAMRFDRVLLGSDHPVFDPVRGLEVLRDLVGLSDEEVARVARPVDAIFVDRRDAAARR